VGAEGEIESLALNRGETKAGQPSLFFANQI